MDDGWLLQALCDRVKSVFYSAKSYIVREGHPVEEVLIVTRGSLRSSTVSRERTGNYNSFTLGAGDICGDLLFWVLDHPSSPLPISNRTSSPLPTSNRSVLTLTDVEGFILLPDDLKFLASHFQRFHRQRLTHMFRYYSPQWRLWAACFIQAAWRRHCRRKLSKALREEEGRLQNALQNDGSGVQQGTKLNLGATLYVSRFVSKTLRNRRENTAECSSPPHMSPQVPHKPADPEFSKDET